MKIRTAIFLGAFLIAIGVNFAFTAPKVGAVNDTALFYQFGICTQGTLNQDRCSELNTGPACTIYDDIHLVNVQAYGGASDPVTCINPLYQPLL